MHRAPTGNEGGVRVLGVRRHVDPVLLSERRTVEASLANASTLEDAFDRLQLAMGLPNQAGSLTDRLTQVERSLTEATSAPEDDALLGQVVQALGALTGHLNGLAQRVQAERGRADAQIAADVATLNRSLGDIEDLTDSIRKHVVLGHDVSAMLDQRQTLIEVVNEIVPVAELDRGNGNIALMSTGGLLLFDGAAADLSFTATRVVTADMSLENGTLSGLIMNGREISLLRQPNSLAGGRLAALFQLRDFEAVRMQEHLDGYARDLIERFEAPTVDTTRSPGDPGLLTDQGTLFDPQNEIGLSLRLSINTLVDSEEGGALWRLRDGLGTSTSIPGDEGDASLILRLSDALAAYEVPASDAFADGARTAASLASDLASWVGNVWNIASDQKVFTQAQYDALKEMELAGGVDTDAEMQKLLLIEQTYAANARVVQVADEMLDWLMRI